MFWIKTSLSTDLHKNVMCFFYICELHISKLEKNSIKLARGGSREGLFSSSNFTYYARIINAISYIFAYADFLEKRPVRNSILHFFHLNIPRLLAFSCFSNTHLLLFWTREYVAVIFVKKSREIDHHDRLVNWDNMYLYSNFDFKSFSLSLFFFLKAVSRAKQLQTANTVVAYLFFLIFMCVCMYMNKQCTRHFNAERCTLNVFSKPLVAQHILL